MTISIHEHNTQFYAFRYCGDQNDRSDFVQIGDFWDIDMGSFTTMDGLLIVEDLDEIPDDLLELIGEEQIQVVELQITPIKLVREIREDEDE